MGLAAAGVGAAMPNERETVCRKCGVTIVVTDGPDEGVELLLICPECTEGAGMTASEQVARKILTKLMGSWSDADQKVVQEILEAAGIEDPEPTIVSEDLERDVSELMDRWDVSDLVDEDDYFDDVTNLVHKHWGVRDDIWKEELGKLWAEHGEWPEVGKFCRGLMERVAR